MRAVAKGDKGQLQRPPKKSNKPGCLDKITKCCDRPNGIRPNYWGLTNVTFSASAIG